MIRSGLRAKLTCVDTNQLDAEFVGREFDGDLLAALPAGIDPCGEKESFTPSSMAAQCSILRFP
jgi:diphthamide synthase (EF-2-diphthine--ammonia ligase)